MRGIGLQQLLHWRGDTGSYWKKAEESRRKLDSSTGKVARDQTRSQYVMYVREFIRLSSCKSVLFCLELLTSHFRARCLAVLALSRLAFSGPSPLPTPWSVS